MIDIEGKLRSLLNAKIEAYGNADAGSDADTLVDAARLEANHYWDGLTLLMLSGNNAGISRPIVEYMLGVGIEVRPAYPNAIAAGDIYVILSNYHEIVPAVDGAENYLPRDVIGRKDDTAIAAADNVSSIMRYLKGLITGQVRQLFSMDFWSDPVEEKAVTGAQVTAAVGAAVVVADLPAGATIVRAIVMMKFRMVENTNAAENSLDCTAPQPIQVDDSANTGWVTAIDFVDEQFKIAATTREGGDVLIGDNDVAARVDGLDTYDFQWLNAKAHLGNIQFNDIQMGIRIWYSL